MDTEDGDETRDASALEAALGEALVELRDTDRGAAPEGVGYRWLGIGLRLGMERPDQARHLLELIAARDADLATPSQGDAGGDAPPASGHDTEGPGRVPVTSAVLARSAAMTLSERAGAGPEVTFGWATRLTRSEILTLGRVVHEMLTAGAPPNVGRGFGLAWDAGVRIPRQERDAMLREFTELEITAASVLAGRDLRVEAPAPRPQGLGALFEGFVRRRGPGESEAGAVIVGSGEPGRHALVALWNAWVAMRYRALIPSPTFELLVRPWVTVVGPLPMP